MKPATALAALIFSIISIVQLLRLALQVPVTVAGRVVPLWPSGVVCVVAGGLALMLWQEARRPV
jgi:hypothetical protein